MPSLCLAHLARLLLFRSPLGGPSAEPVLPALLSAPERGVAGGSVSKAHLSEALANTQQPSLFRQVGAEVRLAARIPIHLWVATEPGTLLPASHAIAGAVFLLNPLGLPDLVNYLILQLWPEGWYEIHQKCSALSPGWPVAPYTEGATWVG